MQAIFRPAGDVEIVVSDQVNGVLIEVYEGPIVREPLPLNQDERHANKNREQRQTLVHLSRADARSVASAIMGAAAKER